MGVNNINTRVVADPGDAGAIAVGEYNIVCNMTSAGSETRTLAIPAIAGQTCALCCDTYGGAIAVTAASGVNVAGNTVMTFGVVDEAIFLQAVTKAGVLRWQVVGNDGVALS
tara:strand:- start:320 stop:655 length:336 start_codon:yes stop_codon:yes gene_type:complete